jgi:hypothetical protein
MQQEDELGPRDERTEREKVLEEKVGSRTIQLVLVSLVALIEGLMLIHRAF